MKYSLWVPRKNSNGQHVKLFDVKIAVTQSMKYMNFQQQQHQNDQSKHDYVVMEMVT